MKREQLLKPAVKRIITECLRHLHGGKCLKYVAYRVEYCSTLCSQAMNSTYSFDAVKDVIEILSDMYLKIENVGNEGNVFNGAPGRPKFDISEEILIHLIQAWTNCAPDKLRAKPLRHFGYFGRTNFAL